MHLGSPDSWRVIWVVTAGVFVVVEMLRRLRLWFLPFAVGSAVAAVTAWAGLSVALEWLVFVVGIRPRPGRAAPGGPAPGPARAAGQSGLGPLVRTGGSGRGHRSRRR